MLLKTKAQNKLKSIVGTTNVLTSKEERYCYSFDALNSREQGKLPDSVVFVEFQEQVCKFCIETSFSSGKIFIAL